MFAQAGERISDYEVLKLLGRGSFGVVLLVKDSRWQELALKLVPCDHLDDRDAAHAAATTLAEAQLLQRLRHPQIVSCYDVQFDPSRKCVWLALEFMDGGDLGNHIKARRLHSQPPFSGPFQQRVLSMVGSALHYIHSQGVLHRDVKPPNLLVDRDMQQVKLADFGVSKILEASGFAGTVLGTPAYHPPELVSGKPYGRPADAWALGICLYELASLQRPFDASNQLALVWQIVEHQPAALPPETPNDIVDIIRGLLQKDPEQRLRLEDLGFTMEASHIEPGGSDPDAPDAAKPCPTWSISDCSGVHEAVPEAGYDQGLRKVISDEQVPTPPVAPISLQHLATEGSDLEEVILNDAPISPTTPRLRTEGLTAFAERSPTTPRRNWLSRLGRGLRYGVLGASARDEAVVSAFNEGEVAD